MKEGIYKYMKNNIHLNANGICEDSCKEIQLLDVRNLNPEMVVAINNNSDNENNENEDNQQYCLKTFLKNWSGILFNTATHLAATATLVPLNFWDRRGIIPRLIGAVLGSFAAPVLDKYIETNKDKLNTTALNALHSVRFCLNTVVTLGTVFETAYFNLGHLSTEEQKEVENFFFIVFCERVFWNKITFLFSTEQFLAITTNIFNFIKSLKKYENKNFNNLLEFINRIRSALAVAGFSAVVKSVLTAKNNPENIENNKTLICFGVQLAAAGATRSLLNSIYEGLSWITTKCKALCNKGKYHIEQIQEQNDDLQDNIDQQQEDEFYDAQENIGEVNHSFEENGV